MKIIDLLNKIANGEEIKNFKYDKYTFEYDTHYKNWYDENDTTFFDHFGELNKETLNKEVEIIEENKIPEKLNQTFLAYIDKEYLLEKEDVDRKINEIINRYNILVDKVSDYLKSKGE